MLEKRQVHALPTEKANRKDHVLYLSNGKQWIYTHSSAETAIPHHLYLTSDEEIKDGNWFINFITNKVCQRTRSYASTLRDLKIIATTNPKLWTKKQPQMVKFPSRIPNVPKIPEDFIQAFVKEQGIWEVMLQYEEIGHYSLVNPMDRECSPEEWKGTGKFKLKLNNSGQVIVHKVKEKRYTREDLFKAFSHYAFTSISNQPYNKEDIKVEFDKIYPS